MLWMELSIRDEDVILCVIILEKIGSFKLSDYLTPRINPWVKTRSFRFLCSFSCQVRSSAS